MAEDVIDIIHRLSYEVNPSGLQSAVAAVNAQREEVKRLQDEVRRLGAQYAATAATDIQGRQRIIQQINTHRQSIIALNQSIDSAIVNNQELAATLQQEVGIINLLNSQLEILRRNRAAATDPAQIQQYNQQISAIQQRIAAQNTVPPGARSAPGAGNQALLGFNNIIRDSPYGIIGISNNITQLTDSFSNLTRQTGSAAGAFRAMGASLLGAGGIAVAISLVTTLMTVLVQKYGSLSNAVAQLLGDLTEEEKAFRKIADTLEKGGGEYKKAIKNVAELQTNIQLAKEGFLDKDRVVKEYNETIGKTTGAVKNLDQAERDLQKNADNYIKFTLLKATANAALEEAAKSALKAEIERNKQDEEAVDYIFSGMKDATDPIFQKIYKDNAKKNKEAAAKVFDDEMDTYEKIAKEVQTRAAKLAQSSGFNFFEDKQTKDKQTKIENIYEQRLQALKARLASITEAAFQSDDTIRAKIAEAIQKDQLEIDKAFKDKKLTGTQRDTLTALLGTIKDAEIDKALSEFNKARMAAQKKIDDELNSLILEDSKQRADLILDDFDRQSAKLGIEYQAQVTALQKAKEALLKENAEKANSGLIDEATALENIDKIEKYYGKLFIDLGVLFQQNKAKLSLSLFDQALSFDKTGFSQQSAAIAEQLEVDVKKLSDSYIKGEISYKKYQQVLTQTLREGASTRRQINLNELEDELELQQRKLEAAEGVLSLKEINAIEKRIADLRAQIATLKQETDTANANNKKTVDDEDKKRRDQKIAGYKAIVDAAAEAARQLVQIEQDRVEREINIQQQRINRAQAIADRGNAKTLQAEEERLNKLQKEREKFARQQIAINAIQTVSNSVLAIAQAAGETGAGAIAIVPAVIAALAAGFAAVRAMTADAGSFRDGVVDMKGPGTTTSDSIPANLSRGESVITANATAKHKEILEGMNAGKRYQLIGDKIMEMSQGTNLQLLQSAPLRGMITANNGGGQSDKKILKRLEAIEQAVLSKPTQTWHLDRRGFVAMYQDEISFHDKMKKL